MTIQPTTRRPLASPADRARSELSLAFETFWHALPKDGPVPRRRDMQLRKAAPFLQHLVLMETPLVDEPVYRIRVVGSALGARAQSNLSGHDYLDFLPRDLRPAVIESSKLIVTVPCGLWQIMPVFYERGLAQDMEITVFPLLGDDGRPLLLVLTQHLDDSLRAGPRTGRPMAAGPATAFQFLDAGAGVPPWPPV